AALHLHSGLLRVQSTVHRHGLRPVFDGRDRRQATVAAQRIARRAMAGSAADDTALVETHDFIEQAHRAGLRHERGDRRMAHAPISTATCDLRKYCNSARPPALFAAAASSLSACAAG